MKYSLKYFLQVFVLYAASLMFPNDVKLENGLTTSLFVVLFTTMIYYLITVIHLVFCNMINRNLKSKKTAVKYFVFFTIISCTYHFLSLSLMEYCYADFSTSNWGVTLALSILMIVATIDNLNQQTPQPNENVVIQLKKEDIDKIKNVDRKEDTEIFEVIEENKKDEGHNENVDNSNE